MAIEMQQPQTSVAPVRMSFEDFLKTYESVEGVQAEWVAGEVDLYPLGNNDRHQTLVALFYNLFLTFLRRRGLGTAKLAGYRMFLGPDKSAREPDVLVIFSEHIDRIKETYLDGQADIVVEVVSPESDERDHGAKFLEYEAAGVLEYWLVDPLRKEATVYTLGEDKRYHSGHLNERGQLISLALPGFAIALDLLWQESLEPDADTIAALVEQMG
jgi:Uma2 family endonuclease